MIPYPNMRFARVPVKNAEEASMALSTMQDVQRFTLRAYQLLDEAKSYRDQAATYNGRDMPEKRRGALKTAAFCEKLAYALWNERITYLVRMCDKLGVKDAQRHEVVGNPFLTEKHKKMDSEIYGTAE